MNELNRLSIKEISNNDLNNDKDTYNRLFIKQQHYYCYCFYKVTVTFYKVLANYTDYILTEMSMTISKDAD